MADKGWWSSVDGARWCIVREAARKASPRFGAIAMDLHLSSRAPNDAPTTKESLARGYAVESQRILADESMDGLHKAMALAGLDWCRTLYETLVRWDVKATTPEREG